MTVRIPRTPPVGGALTSSEWLAWVKAQLLNGTGQSAEQRQLTVAADREPVRLVYGEDRLGAQVLNVIPSGQNILVQCLWALAGDSLSDVRYADKALPAGASVANHPDGGTDSAFNAAYLAAIGFAYPDSLAGYSWSVVTMPVTAFSGSFEFSARVKGRKCYDPRKDSTMAGGSGAHRLATPATWEWTDCPALADADYLYSTAYGCGKTVDWLTVMTAANANDALVGGEKRRRLDGLTIPGMQPVKNVSETLRTYAGCFHVPGPNGMQLVPDRPAASVATYSHVGGSIAGLQRVEKRDTGELPTAVEAIFTDRSLEPWRDDSALAELPGAGSSIPYRLQQVRLPAIQRHTQANREAVERLNKLTTADLALVLDVFDIGIAHELGDVITIADHPVGLSNKEVRIADAPESIGRGLWRLPCVEYDPAAYSDAVVTGPTYPDTNLGMPDPDRRAINLLRNADWNEDVGVAYGFYGDARALPGWTFNRSDTHGQVLRNYDSGHRYSFGRGGACQYIPNYTSSPYEYCYLEQRVPWDGTNYPDDKFEGSAYLFLSRGNAWVLLRALDAAGTTVIAEQYSTPLSVGAGSYGNPDAGYVEGNYKRLWALLDASGAANKTNIRWVSILLIMQATVDTGGPPTYYPFSAWHKAMLCRAPANVTEATASAWSEGSPSVTDGQLTDHATRTVSDTGVVTVDGSGQYIDTFSFTPKVAGWMKVRVTADSIVGSASGFPRVMDLVIVQTTGLLSGYQQTVGVSNADRRSWADAKEVFVQAGVQVDIKIRGYCIGTVDSIRLQSLVYNATVTRKVD